MFTSQRDTKWKIVGLTIVNSLPTIFQMSSTPIYLNIISRYSYIYLLLYLYTFIYDLRSKILRSWNLRWGEISWFSLIKNMKKIPMSNNQDRWQLKVWNGGQGSLGWIFSGLCVYLEYYIIQDDVTLNV